jgi:hypothetical protein
MTKDQIKGEFVKRGLAFKIDYIPHLPENERWGLVITKRGEWIGASESSVLEQARIALEIGE